MHKICKLYNPGLAQGMLSFQHRKASGHKLILSILRKNDKEGRRERRKEEAMELAGETVRYRRCSKGKASLSMVCESHGVY